MFLAAALAFLGIGKVVEKAVIDGSDAYDLENNEPNHMGVVRTRTGKSFYKGKRVMESIRSVPDYGFEEVLVDYKTGEIVSREVTPTMYSCEKLLRSRKNAAEKEAKEKGYKVYWIDRLTKEETGDNIRIEFSFEKAYGLFEVGTGYRITFMTAGSYCIVRTGAGISDVKLEEQFQWLDDGDPLIEQYRVKEYILKANMYDRKVSYWAIPKKKKY